MHGSARLVVGVVCVSHDVYVYDSTIWLVCTVGYKLHKSYMAFVPGLFSRMINRCGSARLGDLHGLGWGWTRILAVPQLTEVQEGLWVPTAHPTSRWWVQAVLQWAAPCLAPGVCPEQAPSSLWSWVDDLVSKFQISKIFTWHVWGGFTNISCIWYSGNTVI